VSRTAWIITCASAILLLSMLVLMDGGRSPVSGYGRKPGPDSWSTSAIGFAGLYKVLEASMDGAGRQRRLDSKPPAGALRLHVITGGADVWRPHAFKGVLVAILPKWLWAPDRTRPGWVGPLVPDASAARLMAAGMLDLTETQEEGFQVVRRPRPAAAAMAYGGAPPEIPDPVQVMEFEDLPEAMTPLITIPRAKGPPAIVALMAETGSGPVVVISDPDALNNMGLAVGNNPAFAADLFEHIRQSSGAKGPPIFVEAAAAGGGGGSGPDPGSADFFASMFRFPLIIVSILVAATIALVALAASGRFGGLPKDPADTVFGKAKLIDNSARLLALSGGASEAIDDYLDLNLRLCGRLTRAPAGLDRAGLMEWLAAAARARGLPDPSLLARRAARVRSAANRAALVSCARNIHRWRTDLEHGPSSRTDDSR
jgi:hypothetical protein